MMFSKVIPDYMGINLNLEDSKLSLYVRVCVHVSAFIRIGLKI